MFLYIIFSAALGHSTKVELRQNFACSKLNAAQVACGRTHSLLQAHWLLYKNITQISIFGHKKDSVDFCCQSAAMQEAMPAYCTKLRNRYGTIIIHFSQKFISSLLLYAPITFQNIERPLSKHSPRCR